MKNLKLTIFSLIAVFALAPVYAVVIDVTGAGLAKIEVAIEVENGDFARTLKRNLELSDVFIVKSGGAVKVSGVPGSLVTAEGLGKRLSTTEGAGDAKAVRMAARKFSDAMVKAFSKNGQLGVACNPLTFVKRGGKKGNEICFAYPDGGDVRQLTSDSRAALCPRWKNPTAIYYIGYLNGSQRVYELDLVANKRSVAFDIRGISSPAVVSPDGRRVAVVSSFQGNPELYVIEGQRLMRMTSTPNATEGCPSWSPDGREIVYVSDASRRQQLYVVDVATRKTRRLTTRGRSSVEPDWGPDGRIAYVNTGSAGTCVAVIDPAQGDAAMQLVTDAGKWEHPSWAGDARHIVASRDKALFIVDTEKKEGGGVWAPRQVFSAAGNWIDPTWMR